MEAQEKKEPQEKKSKPALREAVKVAREYLSGKNDHREDLAAAIKVLVHGAAKTLEFRDKAPKKTKA